MGLGSLIILIALRIPIAFGMIIVGGIGVTVLNGPAIFLSQLKDLTYIQFSIYDLSVIPMFVLMGNLASRAGLSQELFRAANAWLGWARGGVAMSAIVACAGFGAVCGSSLATASTMGKVALPELEKYKYPPSLVLVIYAILVEANIVTMFMAAFVPGIIAVILFLITIMIYVRVFPNSGPARDRIGRDQFWQATFGVLPVLLIFGCVIGGIFFGVFNPTPAAAVGVFLVGGYAFIRGRVSMLDLKFAGLDTAKTTGMIFLILLGAEMLKIFMARGGVPQALAEILGGSGLEPMMIMIFLLLGLIVLGCLMDSLSMILLAIPFFWPVIIDLDFGMNTEDLKIWFGILAMIVVELGLITPPVGMNVFVISAMAKNVPMATIFKGVTPFFASEILRVILILMFPGLVLWLPTVLGG